MKPAGKSPRAKKNRRTIGLLIGRLGDIGYAANVWPGVADVAAERDANLICFVGGALNALHEFDLQRNVIYDLASPENVDGLVAMSGSIGQFVGPERVLRYYDRFRPLPMISVAMALDGFPAVLVDNATGVRQAITHLIEVHGFRRIAFIRGPSTNTEAEERFRTYREVLDAHHLPFDADLVTDGNYLAVAGAAAVHRLLDERKVSFEAIASANDEMAIGAMSALRERGMRVPEDMSVTGFDNIEEARYAAPPLTTVRQPLYEQGRKATEMLLDLLAGKDIPRTVVLPTELVIRQSCGCLPRVNGFIADEMPAANAPKLAPAARRKKILEEMTVAAGVSAPGLESGWQERLLDSLSTTAAKKNPHGVFLHAWDDTLRRVGAQGGDVTQWREVLAVLRRQALPASPAANREDLDTLWRQAENLIGDIAQWSQVYRRLQANRRAFDFMTSISEPLMTAFDIAGLADVVADQLPRMGVRACYLSLYDKPEGAGGAAPTAWSRLILAYNESGRVKLPPEGIRFPSRQLVPREILPPDKRYARMLEPLHFRDETQLGFLLLEPLQTEVGAHREALSRQISTALKGAILLQERQQAEQLLRASEQAERRFQERLRTLIEFGNELSRAESVDAMCRQAVEQGRLRLGFDRIGIWFRSPEPGFITGSWGTDENGGVRDERGIRLPAGTGPNEPLLQKHPAAVRQEDVDLRDSRAKPIGRGMHAQAAMWDGEKTIGLVVIDNLLNHKPITDHDCDLLNLFASTLGYLCSRKRAEETLRSGEQKEREFQERLRILLEISNELSRAESLDALCRLAVELGRNRLGFDRLSIWFYNPDPGIITGSFGTGPDGMIVDERGVHLETTGQHMEILRQTRPIALVTADADLRDMHANVIGRGSRVHAAMWNGEKVIGFVSMDNLLCHRAVTDNDAQLLNSFACTLGYLCSRKRIEEQLRESEQSERQFEERLRTLLELSNELSRAESLDAMCRQAVELGRARFGFDRLGIWFRSPEPGFVTGSWGTDENGGLRDERNTRHIAGSGANEPLNQKHPTAFLQKDINLLDEKSKVIGRGMHAQAAMWDGEQTIGLIVMDNLLQHRPITEQDCELLNLYASTLGNLVSRKRTDEQLRESEQSERRFEERLRVLMEISNELSRAESVDDLCRQAVELGRTRLDFDRLAIWFYSPDPGIIIGSFGTGPDGAITDERAITLNTADLDMEILQQTRPIALVRADSDLHDMHRSVVGRGSLVHAAMWNGEKVIGFVAMDNLVRHRTVSEQDCELLNLFASSLGYLCSRQRVEETLRDSEQMEREFQERLRTLLEISNELSRAESLDALCREAVELGRTRLGFDRLGIWFYSPDPGIIDGSFGTDANGGTVDERGIHWTTADLRLEILNQTRPVALLTADADLSDGKNHIIGRGSLAQAAMWNGEKVIGYVSMDNLLRHRPVTEQDCELLNLFASTLGYLTSRKRAEETLRENEQRERRFQDRLRVLLEISNELSIAESVDSMCRQAVELGRARLGFDRLGIWFYSPDLGMIQGSYGTDENGALRDERESRRPAATTPGDVLYQTSPVALLDPDIDLKDENAKIIGRGSLARAAMWDGEKVIGFVSMDNFLKHQPITVYDCELLTSFASTLGYLCSRKRTEDTLRESERKERSFQERLRVLLEISNELSRAESVDDLCRLAVELGRARLDFDRLGIWFHRPEAGIIDGSFGTDAAGNTVDERAVHLPTRELQLEILKQTRPIALRWPNAVLRDGNAVEIGRGDQAQAAMWNGEKVIGFISMDNLLRRCPITEQDCDILNLFASTLGYLSSRKQAEEELREYSENLEEKVDERTRALRQAQDDLVRQEKLAVLGQLTATVSHELRNPLATIRVSATAVDLKTRDRGLGVERALDRIQRNITRCDTIISELLDYTRMPDLDRQTIDFDDWLNRLLDEQMIPEGISLRRDLASGVRIRLDGERFQRVVINLLDNARQAIQTMTKEDEGAKELAVESRQEAGRLVLSIRDTGGGIPPEVLPRIFEPLFSTKGFGVGLGLSIVKGIVEQHGGTIEITSEPGRGTTAVVRLPLSEPPG